MLLLLNIYTNTNFLDSEKRKSLLSNVSSSDCLKIVVSYIKNNKTLNIIKYNKKLQNRLEINISNYIKIYQKNITKKINCLERIYCFEKLIFPLYYLIFLFVLIGTIILFATSFKLYFHNYNRNLNDIVKNWKLSPIKSINFNLIGEQIMLGSFQSIKEKFKDTCYDIDNEAYSCYSIFTVVPKKNFNFWENKSFYVERYNNLKYEDLIDNKKGNKKFCGYDNKNNKLYFENECPINYIEITNDKKPSKNLTFETIEFNDSKYLHYTNEYIEGKIIIDFKISSDKGLCEYKHDINELGLYFINNYKKFNNKYHGCYDNSYDSSYNQIDNMSIIDLLEQNQLFNAKNYLNSKNDIYLYSRTYRGIKSSSKGKIKFVIQNYKLFDSFIFIFLFYVGQNLFIFIHNIVLICILISSFNSNYNLKNHYILSILILIINFIEIIFFIFNIKIYFILKIFQR